VTSTAILIPARYESTRFSGKPLCDLAGYPMIRRVADAASKSGYPVYVLTDDTRVANCVSDTYPVIIDKSTYTNGTERCSGAVNTTEELKTYEHIINVQGDMPDVSIEMIEECISGLNNYQVSTVYTTMPNEERLNPNSVKCILSRDRVLWMARGIVGYGAWHLGVYGYKAEILRRYNGLPTTEEEILESLEQLRWLKNDINIGALPVRFEGVEINTVEDLHRWRENARS